MNKINDEIIWECKKIYEEQNIPCAQIAKQFGMSSSTLRRRLKALGVEIIQHPHAGKFEIDEVIELYQKGTQIWKIAEMFKSSEETISKVLKESDIKVERKTNFNTHIFDSIDTEEKAYWLGFLWADGCVITHTEGKYNYAIELGLSIKDYDHLEKFCDFISLSRDKIKIKDEKKHTFKNKVINSGKICRIQISNKHLWNVLNNYGCYPNKTHNEIFPDSKIFSSIDLIPHFLRGFFDGDGWIYLDNRKYLVAGVCGQEQFLNEILKCLPEHLRTISVYSQSDTEVIKTIKWAHLKAQDFINYLYNNSTIHLTRKFNIAAPYIREGISKSGNIGETPEMDNTEITGEIKESPAS